MVAALWRGIDVFRPLALAYAVWSAWDRRGDMVRPGVAWAVLAVLAAWTLFLVLYRRRTPWVVLTELGLAAAGVLATRLVDSPAVIAAGAQTVPTIWPAAGVVSAAVLWGRSGGLAAAVLIGAVDLVEVGSPTGNTVNNIVLLLLVGALIGYSADLAREGHEKLLRALELQAGVRERERLARTVHDGVLQTLAFVNRRGAELGGEAAGLGAMAAEQEQRLRELVSGVSQSSSPPSSAGGEVDLRVVLAGGGGGGVSVVSPAEPVLLRRPVAEELGAAVAAALDNVRRHAGEGALAWVLVEDEGPTVCVTVRDNGAGMPPGRLEEAAAAGRLGAAASIRGRLRDLGGQAEWSGREGSGVTVRMRAPKDGVPTRGVGT